MSAFVPQVGGQVFIEPGQTDEEIEAWFRILNENGMNVCRIRMFEDYMRQGDVWDFSLFDKAFEAAEKYDVKIFATLFPATPNNSIGGFKFPLSNTHEKQIAAYIEKTVTHFKKFKSLHAWVLINEPGNGYIPGTEYSKQKFEEWKQAKVEPEYDSKSYIRQINFDKESFLVDYNTWYLNWIAEKVAKYDTESHIHVNNHQIFENVAEYDFPAWRSFLSSLGASAHASWHFSYFKRERYPFAMFANCAIIRSGAGELPFWVTELQGGNNTYSGGEAFCPTHEEITQWLWSSIASGAKGIIFWSLNPRSIGEEAGEWALLDFQNGLSDRFESASEIVECLKNNEFLFDNVKPVKSGITLIYNRESLWVEKKVKYGSQTDTNYEGRQQGGVMKSMLAYYEVLLENGINSDINEINEFDWNKNNYKGQTIVLANQISIPSRHWENIRNFVKNGGKLIVEGLTAFYDENMLSLHNTGFPLEDVFGGALKEVKCIPGDFVMNFNDRNFPVHLWKSYIHNNKATTLSKEGQLITATTHTFGNGKVVWYPSLLGLGGRRAGNYSSLSALLRNELKCEIENQPVILKKHEKDLILQSFTNNGNLLFVLMNKSKQKRKIELDIQEHLKPMVIFANKGGIANKKSISIEPEETMVLILQ